MKKEHEFTYELIEEYNPSCEEEEDYKRQMLDLLKVSENPFDRSHEERHFTASAFLLNRDLTHVLLMHHTKLDMWMQLGGHCDGESDVLKTAITEAREESGIEEITALSPEIFDIDIHLIPARGEREAHYHYDIRFLLHACGDDTVQKNHESKELRWISRDGKDIPTKEPSVLRMFDKLKMLEGIL